MVVNIVIIKKQESIATLLLYVLLRDNRIRLADKLEVNAVRTDRRGRNSGNSEDVARDEREQLLHGIDPFQFVCGSSNVVLTEH